jgi:dGTPase
VDAAVDTHASQQLDFTREHADPLAERLPPLVADRHRVVHAAAFRRLLQKTQVFVAIEDDHFRTRMTHTLEVAHLARLLAARLGLNADLAEIVALAHDLGHPPFGHAGEAALSACMEAVGGFEHNRQTLRIVEELEHPYPAFRGLNLTWAVRECLAKHETRYDQPGAHPLQDGRPPPTEGRVVALADRISYGLHDLQDGLYAGVIDPEAPFGLALWRSGCDALADGWPSAKRQWPSILRPVMDQVVLRLVEDIVAEARSAPAAELRLSASAEAQLRELDVFLVEQLYRSQRLVRADTKAKRVVRAVFDAYIAEPRLMPRRYVARVETQGVHRVVGDYLSGMTDRYCLQEHARLFDPRA